MGESRMLLRPPLDVSLVFLRLIEQRKNRLLIHFRKGLNERITVGKLAKNLVNELSVREDISVVHEKRTCKEHCDHGLRFGINLVDLEPLRP